MLDAGVLSGETNFDFFKNYTTKIQQYASLCRLYGDQKTEKTLVKCFSTLAQIDIMTDRLYPFARFETESINGVNVTNTEIKSYLLNNLRRDHDIKGSSLDKLIRLGHFD